MAQLRVFWLSSVFILAVVSLAQTAAANGPPEQSSQMPPTVRVVDLKASDGTILKASYYAAGKTGPGVLLLHQVNRTRKAWDYVAMQLAAAGINTLTLDMRGYGESCGSPCPVSLHPSPACDQMPRDVDAALIYLASQPGVEPDVIGVGGAGLLGVDDSVLTARRHSAQIKSLVLLSGETFEPGVEFLRQTPQLPGLFVVADDDEYPPTVEAMQLLYISSSNPGKKFVHYSASHDAPWLWYEPRDIGKVPARGGHGTDMFKTHPELPGIIVDWFVTTLIETPGHAPPDTVASASVIDQIQRPGGAAQVARQLAEARQKDPGVQLFPEITVSIIGQDHMRAGETKVAVEVLKLDLLAYPDSAEAHETLAEAYLQDGQNDLARQHAEKALALLDFHTAPASSWTDTEQYRGEIRRGAQKVLEKASAFRALAPLPLSPLLARLSAQNALFERAYQDDLHASPETETVNGDYRDNAKLDDYSLAANARQDAVDQVYLSKIRAISAEGFPEQDRISHELFIQMLSQRIADYDLKQYEMPVSQMAGVQNSLADLPNAVPLDTVQHYQDYIARLYQISRVFSQTIEVLRQGLKDGLMPPRILLDQVPAQCEGTISDDPFLAPTKTFPASISAADQKRLTMEIVKAINTEVIPAYRNFSDFIANEYAPHGRTTIGLGALPAGARRYQQAILEQTSTNLTANEIYSLGLREVARILSLLTELAHKQGYPDLASYRLALNQDPKYIPMSADQIVDDFRKYVKQMEPKLPELFDVYPKTPLVVEAVPASQPGNPTHYIGGTLDGSRPARVVVSTSNFAKRRLFSDETIAYHEGVPGHHLQISIQQQLKGLPEFRLHIFSAAYAEGWAVYAEALGKEIGFFQDPGSDYGRLNTELMRAVRMVVDTGIHSRGWTREHAVSYFRQSGAADEPTIQAEVDRYIAWPAQGLSYKIGQLKILELRNRAQTQLGSRFDIHAFHSEVLNAGNLPLSILEARVDAWIEEQLGTATPTPALASSGLEPGTVFRDCPDCPEMKVIPGGSFTMGSPVSEKSWAANHGAKAEWVSDESPQHLVTLRSFAIGKYDVTRGEYAVFVRETGYPPGDGCGHDGGQWNKQAGVNWQNPGFSQTDRDPVVCVSWKDARAYVSWLNSKVRGSLPGPAAEPYRLPSESEWEYAARGGTTTRFWWGDNDGIAADHAWLESNSGGQTHPVGLKPANPFGLYDMVGNVWQWTEDCYAETYAGAPTDGMASEIGDACRRVDRGSSWFYPTWLLRSAVRERNPADYRDMMMGFRLARKLP